MEPTVESIKAKFGDFDQDCVLESEIFRKVFLDVICSVVKDLRKLSFEQVDIESLDEYYSLIQDVEFHANIDMAWLRTQLDNLKRVIILKVQLNEVESRRDARLRKLKEQEEELEAIDIRRKKLVLEMGITNSIVGGLSDDYDTKRLEYLKLRDNSHFALFG